MRPLCGGTRRRRFHSPCSRTHAPPGLDQLDAGQPFPGTRSVMDTAMGPFLRQGQEPAGWAAILRDTQLSRPIRAPGGLGGHGRWTSPSVPAPPGSSARAAKPRPLVGSPHSRLPGPRPLRLVSCHVLPRSALGGRGYSSRCLGKGDDGDSGNGARPPYRPPLPPSALPRSGISSRALRSARAHGTSP